MTWWSFAACFDRVNPAQSCRSASRTAARSGFGENDCRQQGGPTEMVEGTLRLFVYAVVEDCSADEQELNAVSGARPSVNRCSYRRYARAPPRRIPCSFHLA